MAFKKIRNSVEIEDFELGEINHIIRIFNKYKFGEVYYGCSIFGATFSNQLPQRLTGIGVLEFSKL